METAPTQPVTPESVAAGIRLRGGANTREMVKDLARELFFTFGETPNPSRVLQLLRYGSMTTVTDAMREFWQEVREKTEIRLRRPDVPDALLQAAGNQVEKLWGMACAMSDARMDELRGNLALAHEQSLQAAADAAEKARQEVAVAKAALDAANAAAARERQDRAAAEKQVIELTADLAVQSQAAAESARRIEELVAAAEAECTRRAAVEAKAAADVEALQQERQRDRDLVEATQKRAATEIDAARQNARSSAAALLVLRRERKEADKRLEALLTELSETRERLSNAQAQLVDAALRETALTETVGTQMQAIDALRAEMATHMTAAAVNAREAALFRVIEAAGRIEDAGKAGRRFVVALPLPKRGGLRDVALPSSSGS